MIIERKVRFGQGRRGRKTARETVASDTPTGRVPRVAKLMALAIRFESLIQSGTVAGQSELACLAKVTQPRMTQIMNLLLILAIAEFEP